MTEPATNLFRIHAEGLVTERGTLDQRERLEAGVLPEDDLERAVRDILFAPIAGHPRWRKIRAEHVRELAVLRGAVEQGAWAPVEFETVEADEFSAEEWKRLKELREALPEATVSALWVVAICGKHEEFTTRYPKARVVLNFYGRDLVREVSLRD
jgi:hypothetical protein